MQDFQKIFPLTDHKKKLNEMVRAVNGVSPLVGAGGSTVSSGGGHGATVASDPSYDGNFFFVGKIIAKLAADGDARYSVQAVYLPAFSLDPNSVIHNRLSVMGPGDGSSHIITVTNLAEIRPDPISPANVPGPINQLLIGQYVRVWLMMSSSSGSGFSGAVSESEFWVMHEHPYTLYEGCCDQEDSNCSPGLYDSPNGYSRHKTAVRFGTGFKLRDDSPNEDEVLVNLNVGCCSGISVSYGVGPCAALHFCWTGLYIENCDKTYQKYRQAVIFGSGLKVTDTTTTVKDCNGADSDVEEAKIELCLEAGDGILIEAGEGTCCYKISASCCYSGVEIATSCGGTTQGGIKKITFGDGLQVGYPAVDEASVSVCIQSGANATVTKSGCCYVISTPTWSTYSGLEVDDCFGSGQMPTDKIVFSSGLKTTLGGGMAQVELDLHGAGNVAVTGDCTGVTVSGEIFNLTTQNCFGDPVTSYTKTIKFGQGLQVVDGGSIGSPFNRADVDLALDAGANITITTSGCRTIIAASCNCSGGTGTGTVVGTGTSGYVARWLDSTTISTGVIFDNGAEVGIGTTTPTAKLEVRKSGVLGQLRLGDPGDTSWSYDLGRESLTNGLFYIFGNQSGATGFVFSGVDGERMRIDPAGLVGIGTSSPGYKLDVAGDINISGVGTVYRCHGTAGISGTKKRIVNIFCSGGWTYYSSETDTYCGGILVGTTSDSDTKTNASGCV